MAISYNETIYESLIFTKNGSMKEVLAKYQNQNAIIIELAKKN